MAALFSISMSTLGTPIPAISLSQAALDLLLSSAYLADTASSAYQASKAYIVSTDYSKLSTDAQGKLHEAQDKILAVDYQNLPTEVKDWIKAHPYQTAFHVVGGVVFFAPGVVYRPLLWGLGWTSVGPRTGSYSHSLKHVLQSVIYASLPLNTTLRSLSPQPPPLAPATTSPTCLFIAFYATNLGIFN